MTELIAICVVVGLLWFSYQYGWWRPTIPWHYPRILMYHMIANHKRNGKYNKLRVEPSEFEKQVRWLKANGWEFVFVSELTIETDRKQVALTFDDGYRDNLLAADPVLKNYQAKATLYLPVDRHNQDWSVKKKSHHTDQELMLEPKLLDEDVEQMLDSGRWELGSHGISHENLVVLSHAERAKEIQESKALLEQRFSIGVASFAYPFGLYEDEDVSLVQSSAYDFAITTEQGVSEDYAGREAYQLKRVKVSGKNGMYAFELRMRTGKCRLKD